MRHVDGFVICSSFIERACIYIACFDLLGGLFERREDVTYDVSLFRTSLYLLGINRRALIFHCFRYNVP